MENPGQFWVEINTIAISTPSEACGCEEDDGCAKAIQNARNRYNKLNDRIVEYRYHVRHGGADAGHIKAITQRQKALTDSLRLIDRSCKTRPPEYDKWLRTAYQGGFEK